MLIFPNVRGVVTDIEGTTTDIDFVHKVLFPYSAERLNAFVAAHAADPEVADALAAALRTGREEGIMGETAGEASQAAAVSLLHRWIREDRKHPALKAIQGKIWKEGYANKAFASHVYPDVATALERWKAKGLTLAVYSSGSVEAQKQLFGHTVAGDLNPYFSAYFDTKVGAKREQGSYRAIASALAIPAAQLLFLSDIREELDAARSEGFKTAQLIRDARTVRGEHPGATSFTEIRLT